MLDKDGHCAGKNSTQIDFTENMVVKQIPEEGKGKPHLHN